jgi:hypothetical protein
LAGLRPGDTCPRCGQPISFVERRVIRGHVYYYATHVAIVDGRKRFRKCYLRAEQYTYVTGQHADLGLQLKGMIQELQGKPRLGGYLNDILRAVEERLEGGRLRPEEVLELARLLRQYADRLEGLARRLSERAASEEAAKAQPLKVPTVAPQPPGRRGAAGQGGGLKTVTALTQA